MSTGYRKSMVTKQKFREFHKIAMSKIDTRDKSTHLIFVGIILSTFFSAVNRKLDQKILDFLIALTFSLSCSLGIFLIFQRMKKLRGSNLIRTSIILGLVSSAISAIGLGIIQLSSNFRDLSWNVDSRLFLSQSYSYIDHGNSYNSNSYLGFDMQYHASPSYIAAQIYNYLAINPNITLFILIPFLTLLTIYLFGELLLRKSGLSSQYATFGAVILVNISYITSVSQRQKINSPLVSSELMLNSQLAIAVVLATVGIQTINRRGKNLFILAGLISLVTLKPQYIPFAAIILAVFSVIRLPVINFKAILKECLPVLVNTILAVSILLYFTMSKLGPNYIAKFTGIDVDYFLKTYLLILVFALVLLIFLKIREVSLANTKVLQLFLLICFYLSFKLVLDFIKFEPSETTLEKMQIFQPSKPSGDSDFNQGLILFYIMIPILVMILVPSLKLQKEKAVRVVCIILILLSLFRVTTSVNVFLDPSNRGYEAVNLASLREVLMQAAKRIEKPKFLVNDFVDPAESYRRNGSGMYWSSLGIGKFYLSDINTFHFLAPDVEERLAKNKYFFNSRISDFHTNLIDSEDIDFVVINKRCIPDWLSETRPIFSNSEFALIAASAFSRDGKLGLRTEDKVSQIKKFGESPCL